MMKLLLNYMLSSNGFHSKTCYISPFFSKCFSFNLFSTTMEEKPASEISVDMVGFLAESCGFSAEKAAEIVNKRKSCLRSPHSMERAKSVISFLRNTGFDETHIKKIVAKLPRFLASDVEKTLSPNFRVLQDLGLSSSGVGELVSYNPSISSRNLAPAVEFLREVLNNDKQVIQFLRSFRFCSDKSLRKRVEGNIHVLQSCGFIPANLGGLMYRHPMMFKGKPEYLAECVDRAKSLGVDAQDNMFGEALGVMSRMKKSLWEEKLEMYKRHGLTEQDIVLGFRKYPKFITLSESKVAKLLNFFMVELKYSPSELATGARVLGSSMEKRVIPRYVVFKKLQSEALWKSKTPDFLNFVNKSERYFQKTVLILLKDRFPDDYHTYMKAVSSNI